MTDAFGLINLTIGSVEGAEGLASVDWASGGFAFQVEVNSGGGFETFGSMAVTSVPVSLYAASAPEPKADSLAAVTAQEAMDRANADAGLQGQIDGNAADIATNAGAISTNAASISMRLPPALPPTLVSRVKSTPTKRTLQPMRVPSPMRLLPVLLPTLAW